MIINTNIEAMNIFRSLNNTDRKTDKIMEKLASGMKINRAADDSAGLSIATKMRAQIRGLEQSVRNVDDADSLVSTVDGVLSTIGDIIKRIRDLTVGAANDTINYTDGDRKLIQLEIDQLTEEIDKISRDAEFNNKKLLDGSCLTDTAKNELLDELHAEMVRMLGSDGSCITAESCVSVLTKLLNSGAQDSTPPPEGLLGGSLADMNYTWLTTHKGTCVRTSYYNIYSYYTCTSVANCTSRPTGTASTNSYPSTTGYRCSSWTITPTCTSTYGTSTANSGSPPTSTVIGKSSTSTYTVTRACTCRTTTLTASCTMTTTSGAVVSGTYAANYYPTSSCLATSSSTSWTSNGNYIHGCHYFQPAIEYTVTREKNGITEVHTCTAGQTWSNATCTRGHLYMVHPTNISSSMELHDYINMIDRYIGQLKHAQAHAVNVEPPFPDIGTMIKNLGINRKTAINMYYELELLEAESRSYQSIDGVVNNTGLWVQTGANAGQGLYVDISIINSETLGIGDGKGHSKISVNTLWTHEISAHIGVLDYALKRLTNERINMGVAQNRFGNIKQNLEISGYNQQAALSLLQDANMAKEQMSLVTLNILQNAGTLMLAQANSRPESVLQLLR